MSSELKQLLQQRLDSQTKPPGSLGRLEQLALQAGIIWHTPQPAIQNPHIIVFAGDHGIAGTGLVNPYPQSVTAQMVHNFLKGGAAINVLCRLHDIRLLVVDAGVNAIFDTSLPLLHAKIDMGTANYLNGPAMSEAQCMAAMDKGRELVKRLATAGCNTLGLGEMGIGNSSSAALLMHHITHLPLEDCVGKGTGANEAQYQMKINALRQVAQLHHLGGAGIDAVALMQRVGGFELAMMCGAYLEAGAQNLVVLVDGFIATAALLCACNMQPGLLQHCIFSHVSDEKGHRAMLEYLKVTALFDWGMRLGEGTGSAMAIPVLQSALALLRDMATFDQAGVSSKKPSD